MAAALSNPDARPLTADDLKRMKRTPQAKAMRQAFRMTQEQFAETFRVPLGTLRDWEQGRTEPDEAAKAYLWVMAYDPEHVKRALAWRPGTPKPGAPA